MPYTLILVVIFALVVVGTILAITKRIKTCPSDRILVKYGQIGGAQSAKTIHGGTTFIWPVIQGYAFLDLTPMTVDIKLSGALSKQNIRVNVPSRFTFGIGTTAELMNNAAERLLSFSTADIEETAKDIIFGQLRATIATMDIEEINGDRETFESRVLDNIESELIKIGLRLINVNISDITDESGYIEALGQRAAAEAINQARVEVAQQDRDGAVGSAEAEQDQRVRVADANAKAVIGENEAKAIEADSEATLRVARAEAQRLGDASEAVKSAAAEREGYEAEKMAEEARAKRDRASQFADVVVPAEIERDRVTTEAEGEKSKAVLAGEAEGEALRAKLEGEAEGRREILVKMAEGFRAIVAAADGSPDAAGRLMIVDKLDAIVAAQALAISNIDFEKVVVYDGGDGKAVGNFLGGLTHALPSLHELAKMAGMELPEFLGELTDDRGVSVDLEPQTVATTDPQPAATGESQSGEPTG
ncbi:MAG: SPFH domain-containing protein [Gammaproteobacteria bacterium]|nr:SPFH domain-containing protein [Gammaproteobacteria bacterium]